MSSSGPWWTTPTGHRLHRLHRHNQGRMTTGGSDVAALPDVILDKIFPFLPDTDLRTFHQVCVSWRDRLIARPKVNQRRLALVNRIRENRENIVKGTEAASKADTLGNCRPDRKSMKSDTFPAFNNVINQITPTTAGKYQSPVATGPSPQMSSTPSRFIFEKFNDAEKELLPGQKLFRCVRCYGPVVSPVLSFSSTHEEGACDFDHSYLCLSEIGSPEPFSITEKNCDTEFKCSKLNLHNSATLNDSLYNEVDPKLPEIQNLVRDCHMEEGHDISSIERDNVFQFRSSNSNLKTDVSLCRIPLPISHLESYSDYSSILRDASKSSRQLFSPTNSANMSSEGLKSLSFDNHIPGFTVDSVSNVGLNESFILECPNPDCSFRFCSTCNCAEHSGRSCRVIGSDSFTAVDDDPNSSQVQVPNVKISSSKSSMGKGKGKVVSDKNKKQQKKTSLRRLAM